MAGDYAAKLFIYLITITLSFLLIVLLTLVCPSERPISRYALLCSGKVHASHENNPSGRRL